jgi:ATP-dependent helicase/nuclease subunit A
LGRRFQRGLLVHKLLEVLASTPRQARRAKALALLKRSGADIDESQSRTLVEEVLAALDHPDFAPLFGPGSRAEVSIAGEASGLAGTAFLGQVDRLVVTHDEVLIVDYKTLRPVPLTLRDVSPLYVRQMAVYRNLVRTIYRDRPVRCALLWTDGPSLMPLPDELLDGAVEELAAEIPAP